MKFIWSSSAFSCSVAEGDVYATGHIEHIPGSASDKNEWAWRVRVANSVKRKSHFSSGSQPSELAARAEVEKAITFYVEKFGRAA